MVTQASSQSEDERLGVQAMKGEKSAKTTVALGWRIRVMDVWWTICNNMSEPDGNSVRLTDLAQPPFSLPRIAPIQGVPTPSRLAALDSELDDECIGGVEDLLQIQSNGSFTPR